MDEALIQRVTQAVLQRLSQAENKPRALCIGTPPETADFLPVTSPPWEMVVICTLSPAELLAMPNDTVCRALMEGTAVYLMESGLEHRRYTGNHAPVLQKELLAKERFLRSLGIRVWKPHGPRVLITAGQVRQLKGKGLPSHAILTPLAKDIWEGKA